MLPVDSAGCLDSGSLPAVACLFEADGRSAASLGSLIAFDDSCVNGIEYSHRKRKARSHYI